MDILVAVVIIFMILTFIAWIFDEWDDGGNQPPLAL